MAQTIWQSHRNQKCWKKSQRSRFCGDCSWNTGCSCRRIFGCIHSCHGAQSVRGHRHGAPAWRGWRRCPRGWGESWQWSGTSPPREHGGRALGPCRRVTEYFTLRLGKNIQVFESKVNECGRRDENIADVLLIHSFTRGAASGPAAPIIGGRLWRAEGIPTELRTLTLTFGGWRGEARTRPRIAASLSGVRTSLIYNSGSHDHEDADCGTSCPAHRDNKHGKYYITIYNQPKLGVINFPHWLQKYV